MASSPGAAAVAGLQVVMTAGAGAAVAASPGAAAGAGIQAVGATGAGQAEAAGSTAAVAKATAAAALAAVGVRSTGWFLRDAVVQARPDGVVIFRWSTAFATEC